MPTPPVKTLYDPDLTTEQVRPFTDLVVPLLTEVLHYGIALFARCSYRPEGEDENLVILLAYRYLLEMLDAVIILIKQCAPAPAGLQLRSLFEALLTIEYVTESKSDVRRRAFAYLYEVELKRKQFYLSQDVSSPEGKAFLRRIANDPYSKEWKPARDQAALKNRLDEIEKIMSTPEMRQVEEEYKKTRKVIGRRPKWHALYEGPKTIQELADRLRRPATYEILYKAWSERVHSSDAVDRILTHNDCGPAVRGLRDPSELNTATDFAITFSIDAARRLIQYYRHAEEPAFDKWLLEEIMPTWKNLPRIDVRDGLRD